MFFIFVIWLVLILRKDKLEWIYEKKKGKTFEISEYAASPAVKAGSLVDASAI